MSASFNSRLAIGLPAVPMDNNSPQDIYTLYDAVHVLHRQLSTILGLDTNSATVNSVYIGAQSGFLNSGASNVAVGANSTYNGTGAFNASLGTETLRNITTSSFNVAVGYQSLFTTTTGGSNASVGYQALRLATSEKNTALGYQAGNTVTTGSNLALIGFNAQPSTITATNEITLGDANVTVLRCAATSITSLSDVRDKEDIQPLNTGLSFINALKPVSFTWNSRDGSKVGIPAAGFIAQDLDKAQTDFHAEFLNLVLLTNPDKLEAAYGNLISPLVKAVQELSSLNLQLLTRIEKLECFND